jgi:hypothetical protein
LLGLKESSFLQGASLSICPLGQVEDNCVRVKLGRDVAVNWAGGIVLKLGGDKLTCGLGRMIAADAGLRIVF